MLTGRPLLLWCLLGMMLIVVYAPMLAGAPVYEEMDHQTAMADRALGVFPVLQLPGRQMTAASFRLTEAVGGLGAQRAGNLALHLIIGALLVSLARMMSEAPLTPWLAILVFWFHPLQSETVSYAAARAELVSVACLLAAILTYLRWGGGWMGTVGCAAWLLLAAMSKEIAVLGLALILVTVITLGKPWAPWRWAVAGACAAVLLFVWPGGARGIGFVTQAMPVQAHVTSHLSSTWGYVWSFLTFQGLTIDRGIVGPMMSWSVWASVGVAVTGLAIWRWRLRWPLLAWATAWTAIWWAPRLLVDTPDLISERHTYLPMVAWSIALGHGIASLAPDLFPLYRQESVV